MHKQLPEIRFYLKGDPYGCFCNFAPYPVEIDGKIWKTTEHYYHAQRFAGTEYEEVIREIVSPFRAEQVAKSGVYPRRGDWFDVKFDIMMKAVTAKFNQHSNLRSILVSTGNAILKEYLKQFLRWRKRLSDPALKEYDRYYIMPEKWEKFRQEFID